MSNPSKEEMFRPGVTSPISSMSVVVGDAVKARCNGHCPFCISRCTNALGIDKSSFDQHRVDWNTVIPSLRAACRFAKTVGVTNILLTGRGEPTLYKDEIRRYLSELSGYGIAISEGYSARHIPSSDHKSEWGKPYVSPVELEQWRCAGLTHVAVSMAHWDKDRNNEVYGAKVPVDLEDLFTNLRLDKLSVRACLVLMRDYVDSVDDFRRVVGLCNSWGARQLRIASLGRPEKSESEAVARWIDAHVPEHAQDIVDHVVENGHYLRTLPHGAPVFDYEGLSVCVADCMPRSNRVGNGLQPIFWPDGSLTYSWEWKGAVLM